MDVLIGHICDDSFIGKSTDIRVMGKIDGPVNLRFSLMSLDKRLYKFLPFMIFAKVHGQIEAVCEVRADQEIFQMIVPVRDRGVHCHVEICCETAGIPARLGGDEREMALKLIRVDQEQCAPCPERSGFHARREAFSASPYLSGPEPRPIFVIGAYRSLTSITTWLIGQHPNIAPIEETNWLTMLMLGNQAAYRQSLKPEGGASDVYDIGEDDFLRWQGRSVNALHHKMAENRVNMVHARRLEDADPHYDPRFALRRSPFAPKRRWVDGTPENTGIALGVARMFPRAQFVFMLRDPVAVVRSMMSHSHAGGVDLALEAAMDQWEQMTHDAYEAQQVLGHKRVLLQQADRLIEAPHTSISRLFAFLDEPQYDQAVGVLSQRINSSFDESSDETTIPSSQIARLKAIEAGIVAGAPLAQLPWRRPMATYADRENDIVTRLRACIQ